MSKKSQSEIITTILLILIVLAAIAIVWVMVIQFFPKQCESPFTCSDIKLLINEARSNETASHGNEIEIKRLAGGNNDDVKSIKIIIDGQATTIQAVNDIICGNDDDGDGTLNCDELVNGRTAYSLEQIETKTYRVPFISIPRGALVQIAAITDKCGQEKVCEKSDEKRAT